MADILANNNFQKTAIAYAEANSALPYSAIMGGTLKEVMKAHIEGGTGTSFYTAAGGSLTRQICDLTDQCKISHCGCNYSGATTQCTTSINAENVWRDGSVLAQGIITASTPAEIRTYFLANLSKLSDVRNLDTTRADRDLLAAYWSLFEEYKLDAATNAAVLAAWWNYSPGGSSLPSSRAAPLSATNILKVCDSSWQYGYGPASCTWVVPAGATKAKFQVWGAGMGSNPGCCCGGTPSGENGAYSQATMSVTPGDSYTICAGCTCSRYCCSNSTPGEGCMSGVTGPNICCLKADGAHCYQANCDDLNHLRCMSGYPGSACYRFQSPYCTDSGPCWCGLGEYCYDNGCATCGVVPIYPGCCYTLYCSCICDGLTCRVHSATEGHFGMHGGGCLDTNNYGYHIRPPIIDADTSSQWTDGCGCYCQTFTSGTCCGGCNAKDWSFHPGHGGGGTHIMGGTNSHKGDTGRSGMVQISWV